MGDLSKSMNTCVGSPCSRYPDLLAGDPENRLLHFFLYGMRVVLNLPTMEACTIIFNYQLYSAARQTITPHPERFCSDSVDYPCSPQKRYSF
jgi:hypothetical protein